MNARTRLNDLRNLYNKLVKMRDAEMEAPILPGCEAARNELTGPLDDAANGAAGEYKVVVLIGLSDTITSDPRWTEYVEEAEHGDGIAYWMLFRKVADVAADFKVFCENLD